MSRDSTDLDEPPEVIRLTGRGAQLSAPIALTPGRYRITASLSAAAEADVLVISLHKPDERDPGEAEVIFLEFFNAARAWSGSILLGIEGEGEHSFEVKGTDSEWEIEIAPLSELVIR